LKNTSNLQDFSFDSIDFESNFLKNFEK